MVKMLDALRRRFGQFVKFKNGMALPDAAAASDFSAQFEAELSVHGFK